MHLVLAAILLLILSSCSSSPTKKEVDEPLAPVATILDAPSSSSSSNIDYQALKRALGLERDADKLGYRESAFNTCQVGYGYSSTQNCKRLTMVSINYRLQCRESEGTIQTSLTEADIRPIAHREIRWTLKDQKGISQTDDQGHGQILAIFPTSQKTQRLKLATGNEFLYLRAGEINRIVTPQPWCDAR